MTDVVKMHRETHRHEGGRHDKAVVGAVAKGHEGCACKVVWKLEVLCELLEGGAEKVLRSDEHDGKDERSPCAQQADCEGWFVTKAAVGDVHVVDVADEGATLCSVGGDKRAAVC